MSQTDFDGTTKLYNVIQAICNDDDLSDLTIINVLSSSSQFEFYFSTSHEGSHNIKVYDAIGNLIFSEEKYFSKGNNSESIDLSEFSEGIYIVSIRNNYNAAFKKVVVVK